MISLQEQLKNLKSNLIEKNLPGKATLLFEYKDSKKIDKEGAYSLGLHGILSLSRQNFVFQKYLTSLFTSTAKYYNREMKQLNEIEEINNLLNNLLNQLTEYFNLQSCHQILEFLLRVYEIHIYNSERLILSFLPSYETKYFMKLMQNIDFSNKNTFGGFGFLKTFTIKGDLLVKEILYKEIYNDFDLLSKIINFGVDNYINSKNENISGESYIIFLLDLISNSVPIFSEKFKSKKEIYKIQIDNYLRSAFHFISSLISLSNITKLQKKKEFLIELTNMIIKIHSEFELSKEYIQAICIEYIKISFKYDNHDSFHNSSQEEYNNRIDIDSNFNLNQDVVVILKLFLFFSLKNQFQIELFPSFQLNSESLSLFIEVFQKEIIYISSLYDISNLIIDFIRSNIGLNTVKSLLTNKDIVLSLSNKSIEKIISYLVNDKVIKNDILLVFEEFYSGVFYNYILTYALSNKDLSSNTINYIKETFLKSENSDIYSICKNIYSSNETKFMSSFNIIDQYIYDSKGKYIEYFIYAIINRLSSNIISSSFLERILEMKSLQKINNNSKVSHDFQQELLLLIEKNYIKSISTSQNEYYNIITKFILNDNLVNLSLSKENMIKIVSLYNYYNYNIDDNGEKLIRKVITDNFSSCDLLVGIFNIINKKNNCLGFNKIDFIKTNIDYIESLINKSNKDLINNEYILKLIIKFEEEHINYSNGRLLKSILSKNPIEENLETYNTKILNEFFKNENTFQFTIQYLDIKNQTFLSFLLINGIVEISSVSQIKSISSILNENIEFSYFISILYLLYNTMKRFSTQKDLYEESTIRNKLLLIFMLIEDKKLINNDKLSYNVYNFKGIKNPKNHKAVNISKEDLENDNLFSKENMTELINEIIFKKEEILIDYNLFNKIIKKHFFRLYNSYVNIFLLGLNNNDNKDIVISGISKISSFINNFEFDFSNDICLNQIVNSQSLIINNNSNTKTKQKEGKSKTFNYSNYKSIEKYDFLLTFSVKNDLLIRIFEENLLKLIEAYIKYNNLISRNTENENFEIGKYLIQLIKDKKTFLFSDDFIIFAIKNIFTNMDMTNKNSSVMLNLLSSLYSYTNIFNLIKEFNFKYNLLDMIDYILSIENKDISFIKIYLIFEALSFENINKEDNSLFTEKYLSLIIKIQESENVIKDSFSIEVYLINMLILVDLRKLEKKEKLLECICRIKTIMNSLLFKIIKHEELLNSQSKSRDEVDLIEDVIGEVNRGLSVIIKCFYELYFKLTFINKNKNECHLKLFEDVVLNSLIGSINQIKGIQLKEKIVSLVFSSIYEYMDYFRDLPLESLTKHHVENFLIQISNRFLRYVLVNEIVKIKDFDILVGNLMNEYLNRIKFLDNLYIDTVIFLNYISNQISSEKIIEIVVDRQFTIKEIGSEKRNDCLENRLDILSKLLQIISEMEKILLKRHTHLNENHINELILYSFRLCNVLFGLLDKELYCFFDFSLSGKIPFLLGIFQSLSGISKYTKLISKQISKEISQFESRLYENLHSSGYIEAILYDSLINKSEIISKINFNETLLFISNIYLNLIITDNDLNIKTINEKKKLTKSIIEYIGKEKISLLLTYKNIENNEKICLNASQEIYFIQNLVSIVTKLMNNESYSLIKDSFNEIINLLEKLDELDNNQNNTFLNIEIRRCIYFLKISFLILISKFYILFPNKQIRNFNIFFNIYINSLFPDVNLNITIENNTEINVLLVETLEELSKTTSNIMDGHLYLILYKLIVSSCEISSFYKNNSNVNIIKAILLNIAKKSLFENSYISLKKIIKNEEEKKEIYKYQNKSKIVRLEYIMVFLTKVLNHTDKLIMEGYYEKTNKLFMRVYILVEDTNEGLLNNLNDTYACFIKKINNNQLKVIFNLLILFGFSKGKDRNEYSYDINKGNIVLNILNVISFTIKSLFIPYVEQYRMSFIELYKESIVSIQNERGLGNINEIKIDKFPNKTNFSNVLLLNANILSHIENIFKNSNDKAIGYEITQSITDIIIEEYKFMFNEEFFSFFFKKFIFNTVVSIFDNLSDDDLFKAFHDSLLEIVREDYYVSKLLLIRTISGLADTISERYLSLIEDSKEMISELIEDSNEKVGKEAFELIQKLEKLEKNEEVDENDDDESEEKRESRKEKKEKRKGKKDEEDE